MDDPLEIIFDSSRLYFRKFKPQDAASFYQLNLDPEVLKYTSDLAFHNVAEAKNFIQSYKHYELYGIGRWAVIIKSTLEFIGFCGLKYHPEGNITEVGCRFFKKHWNKGYATESITACVKYGFENKNYNQIYAQTHVDNISMQHILTKLGFVRIERMIYDGLPYILFKKSNLI